jgi:uncharacterized protein
VDDGTRMITPEQGWPSGPAVTIEAAGAAPPNLRKRQLLEVLVFLFLIVPSLVLAFLAPQQLKAGFNLVAWGTILRDLSLICLLVYLLWRNGEPMTRLGWHARDLSKEVAIGLLLFFPLLAGTSFLEQYLRTIGFSGQPKSLSGFLTPQTPLQFALAFLLVVVVAVAEETIFRGYLILRFNFLTRSRIAAVLLSSAIFSVGHGYEGAAGVLTVGVLGLAFAAVYLWRRSLVAPIVMHFMQDFIAIVVIPLAAHHQ